jgi:hypothetical protein
VAPVYKLSTSRLSSRTSYSSMLAGNTAYVEPGDFASISTITVGSGGAANVEFTNIPATYTHLQVRHRVQSNRSTYGRDLVLLNINGDTSNMSTHSLNGDGGSISSGAESNATRIFAGACGTSAAGTYFFGGGVIDILDYANTSKYKTTRTLSGVDHNGTIAGFGGEMVFHSGNWRNTNAITSLKFYPSSGSLFTQYSTFALYGIKVVS